MDPPRVRLGELLVRAGLISRGQLEETLALQRRDGRRLGTLLVEAGLVSEAQVTQILSQQLSVPWVSLHHIDFSEQLLELVPRDVVESYCLVPIYVRRVRGLGDALYVAMDDPTNVEALQAVAQHAGLHVRAMIAPPEAIRDAIRDNYGVEVPKEQPSAPAPPVEPEPYTSDDADARTREIPRPSSYSAFDDDDDTDVHDKRNLRRESPRGVSSDGAARKRPDSVVDLMDADVVEVPRSVAELASVDDSILTETTGTLSADDPDVVEISGPEFDEPELASSTRAAHASETAASPAAERDARFGAEDADPEHDGDEPVFALPASRSRPSNPVPEPPKNPPPASEIPARDGASSHRAATARAASTRQAPARSASLAEASAPTQSSPGRAPEAPVPPMASRPAPSRPVLPAPSDAPPARGSSWVPPSSVPPARSTPPSSPISGPRSRTEGWVGARAKRQPVSLTLLDGTTIELPQGARGGAREPGDLPEASSRSKVTITVKDVVSVLRASSRGADVSEMLGEDVTWQRLLAAVLAILARKGLVSDDELREELDKG